MILYVVLSSKWPSFLFCTHDEIKAEKAKTNQIKKELQFGGKPQVYIKETIIK